MEGQGSKYEQEQYEIPVATPGSGAGGHTIEDKGTPMAARTNLDFEGAGVAVTDDSILDKTIVTISGGGSSAKAMAMAWLH